MALSGLNPIMAPPQFPKMKQYKIRKLSKRLSELNPKSFAAHMVRNELARLEGKADMIPQGSLNDYAQFLQNKSKQYADKPGLRWLIQKELRLIDQKRFRGKIATGTINGIGAKGRGKRKLKKLLKKVGSGVKKAFRGLKTVTLAPARNAFLSLIRLNLRGLASKLSRVNQSKLMKLWDRFGGKRSSLQKAISKGKQKRPLLGGKNKGSIRRRRISGFNDGDMRFLDVFNKPIKGIGVQPMPPDESGSAAGTAAAGAAAAGAAALVASNPATGGAAASIIAASAPILIAVTKLLKKEGLDTAEGQMDIDTGEIVQSGTGSVLENIADVVTTAANVLGGGSALPSSGYAVSDVEPGAADNAGLPSDDGEVEDAARSSALPSLPIMAAAGIALFLLFKK